MEQKIIVNGVEFIKVSPRQVERVEKESRQYRSDYVSGSIISLMASLINLVQKLTGATRSCRVN